MASSSKSGSKYASKSGSSAIPSINIKWSEFNPELIGFSKPVHKKDGSRDVYLSYGADRANIIIESPRVSVKFINKNEPKVEEGAAKVEGKANYSISISSENEEFYSVLGTKLNEVLVRKGVENGSAWFGKEQEQELVEDMYVPVFKKKEGSDYAPLLTLKFYESNLEGMFIDKNNVRIENPVPEELLSRDTTVNTIFKLSRINLTDKAFRVRAELVRCRVIEKSTSSSRVGEDISKIDVSSLKLGKVDVMQSGGKRTFVVNGSRSLCLRLSGVKLAPYKIEYVDETNGNISYSVQVVLDNPELLKFIKDLDDVIMKELTARSVEFYGKKKSMLQVKNKFISQPYYSKKVKAEIAEGRTPQYPPTLKIKLMRNKEDTAFNCEFVKADNTKFEGDVSALIPESKDKLFDLDITLRHIWFGKDGESVGWLLNRLVIDDSNVVSKNIRFSDEDEEDVDEDEGDEDIDADKTAGAVTKTNDSSEEEEDDAAEEDD
jgi:hypothetical protein